MAGLGGMNRPGLLSFVDIRAIRPWMPRAGLPASLAGNRADGGLRRTGCGTAPGVLAGWSVVSGGEAAARDDTWDDWGSGTLSRRIGRGAVANADWDGWDSGTTGFATWLVRFRFGVPSPLASPLL